MAYSMMTGVAPYSLGYSDAMEGKYRGEELFNLFSTSHQQYTDGWNDGQEVRRQEEEEEEEKKKKK